MRVTKKILNQKLVKELKNKTVLVTGGAGSLGSELSKKLLDYPIKTLRVLDINEHSLFKLNRQIKDKRLRLLLGDVLDNERIIMAGKNVDIIIHTAAVKNIEITEFKTKIASQKYVLVDVRTQSEFANGHLEGALNIDYFSTTFSDEISKIGFETPVLVYCKSGNRSGKSMKIMNDLGFNEVYNLIGGFKGWVSGKNTITKD